MKKLKEKHTGCTLIDAVNMLEILNEPQSVIEKKSTIMYGYKCNKCGYEHFHEDDACPNCGGHGPFTEITKLQ